MSSAPVAPLIGWLAKIVLYGRRERKHLPALDVGVAVALERQGILAHGRPPHVLDGAAALAVHALDLVLANDGVLERRAVLEDEDGVAVVALVLTGAWILLIKFVSVPRIALFMGVRVAYS